MGDQQRKRPLSRRKPRRDQVDAWFVRIAWVVAAMLLALMLQQAFTMRPVEKPVVTRPAG